MTDSAEPRHAPKDSLDLRATIRAVKNDLADRDDVVVDLREMQRARLELLAEELKPVFAQVPAEDDRFDFAISSGAQPRLWIDAVAHVAMGRDRRSYRFVRDTRLERVVLAETLDMKAVAERVTRYVAERIVERERVLDGEVEPVDRDQPVKAAPAATAAPAGTTGEPATREPQPAPSHSSEDVPPAASTRKGADTRERTGQILRGFGIVLLGLVVGAGLAAAIAWNEVAPLLGITP
ncbi:MAG: hypothetical protein ACXIVF_00885 [Rhizobiaceae bacterium]